MLERLGIHDFRNLAQLELVPAPGMSLIWGANGSGKTSLLEAVHYLATGRSFRTHLIEPLIRHGQSRFVLRAELALPAGQRHRLGIERGRRRVRRRLDGVDQRSQIPLSRLFPVLAIHPDTHLLVSGPPSLRRRFMDWGCFHLDPGFSDNWSRFVRLARHRSELLRRQAATSEIRAIDQAMLPLAVTLDQARSEFLARFQPVWRALLQALFHEHSIVPRIEYLRGWGEALGYDESLSLNLARDRRHGRTSTGPHRASFHLLIDDMPASRVLSRGQQKLLSLSLALAQAQLLQSSRALSPLILIDDLASELDRPHIERVTRYLSSASWQVILTAVEPSFFVEHGVQVERMFHVKHGVVEEGDIMA